jgi:hypothetical protein
LKLQAFIFKIHFFDSATKSGRPIEYVELYPLDGAKIFQNYPEYQSNPDVQAMVADLNGHPRSLFFLAEILRSQYKLSKPSYDDLLEDLQLAFAKRVIPRPSASVLIDCLLAREVTITEKSTPDDLPYSYYIEQVTIFVFILVPVHILAFSWFFVETRECCKYQLEVAPLWSS